MKPYSAFVALLIGSLVVPVRGEEPAEVRAWSSKAGSEIRASLASISEAGDAVTLKREDGRELTVKLAQLSEGDRAHVKAVREKMAAAKAASQPRELPLTDTWYLTEPQWPLDPAKRTVTHNFSLPAGTAHEFEVPGEGEFSNVYLTVDIGRELNQQFDGKKGQFALKLEQVGDDAVFETSGGGGAPFDATKGGKIRLKLTNRSAKTVRIAVSVDKK